MTQDKRQALRAQHDAAEALADAVQERLSVEEWNALIAFNTYCAGRLGWTLEFYQSTHTGLPSYRFRPATPAERLARAEDWVEDQL